VDTRKRVIVLVGLPGSGKSTWAERQGIPVLSSDAVRESLTGDARDQSANARVFQKLRESLSQRLRDGEPATIVDATSLTPADRKGWVQLAVSLAGEAEAVFFDTPLDVCKARNAARSRIVPEDVMDRFAARLVPPSEDEGFGSVRVVRP
jgi:predicted kinase